MPSEDSFMEEVIDLPERMFAVGHEPVGLRLTAYGPTSGITAILETLDPDERTDIANSCFKKFIGLTEKPNFSGRFARFLLSRMLRVNKKHEIWFLFTGKPVRFSLREFALVTGLPCGKFPHKSKKRTRNNISETPHWPSLFGSLETVTVVKVLSMLRNRTIEDKETRMKFAYLVLLASVVLPTTHSHKIVKEHANMMKDMNEFFSYPWGRTTFDMIIKSVKECNEVTLSQNTIAIKGFVFAMQLVMVEAVPSLFECPLAIDPSESESESETGAITEAAPVYLSPSHARRLNDSPTVGVQSIITGDGEVEIEEEEMYWSDEDEDIKVSRMVNLINVEYDFEAKLFTKGVTRSDIKRMIEEEKGKNIAKDKYGRSKNKKPIIILDDGGSGSCQEGGTGIRDVDIDAIASLVASKVMPDIKMLRASVSEVNTKLDAILSPSSAVAASLSNDLCKVVLDLKSQVVSGIIGWLEKESLLTSRHTVVLDNGPSGEAVSNQRQPIAPEAPAAGDKVNESGDVDHDQIITDVLREVSDNIIQMDNTADEVDPTEVEQGPVLEVNNTGSDGNNKDTNLTEVGLSHTSSPSFSLGLTQELADVEDDTTLATMRNHLEQEVALRQSKRTKRTPRNMAKDYQYGKTLGARSREAFFQRIGAGKLEDNVKRFMKLKKNIKDYTSVTIAGVSVPSNDLLEIGLRKKTLLAKVVDLVIHHISTQLANTNGQLKKNVALFDSRFVGLLSKHAGKINKNGGLVGPKFPNELTTCFNKGFNTNVVLDQFYFPFKFDQIHWVGVCVDCVCSTVWLLDCDLEMCTDDAIKSELAPIAQLVPYLLKQVGRLPDGKDTMMFNTERPKMIPQNSKHVDSAVTTTLLIQAPALGGLEMCRCIKPEIIELEAKSLSVLMYEADNGPLV